MLNIKLLLVLQNPTYEAICQCLIIYTCAELFKDDLFFLTTATG